MADNIVVKDGNDVNKTIASKDVGGVHSMREIVAVCNADPVDSSSITLSDGNASEIAVDTEGRLWVNTGGLRKPDLETYSPGTTQLGQIAVGVRNDSGLMAGSDFETNGNADGSFSVLTLDENLHLWARIKSAVVAASDLAIAGTDPTAAALEVQWAAINATASGDTTVVSGVTSPSKKIKVLSMCLVCDAPVNVAWKSASTTKINAMAFTANGGMNVERARGHVVETTAGEALVINLSATANVRGFVTYVLV